MSIIASTSLIPAQKNSFSLKDNIEINKVFLNLFDL